jgi:hypothetical protein
MFIAALFTIAKLWKQPRCPTTKEWIKKMYGCMYVPFFHFHKGNTENINKIKTETIRHNLGYI